MNVPDELYAAFESDKQSEESKLPPNTVPGYSPRSANSLYREEDIDDANLVFVTMTEQAADLLREIGLTSTAPPRSPGSIKTANWKPLTGRPVAIVVEASPDGKKFTTEVIHQLKKLDPTAEIRILDLSTPPMGEDVLSKWIQDHPGQSKVSVGDQLLNQFALIPPFDDGADDESRGSQVTSDERLDSETRKDESPGDFLLSLAKETIATFHTPDGKAYGSIRVPVRGVEGRERVDHYPIRHPNIKDWLILQYYRELGRTPKREAMESTLSAMEAQARFFSEEAEVYLRVAQTDGPEGLTYWLDLADDLGRAVKITAQGWEVVFDPPVKFRKPGTMRSLPVPVAAGSIDELRAFVNVSSDTDADWHLLIAVLTAYLRPVGPYPILMIQGEQGSAKSTTAKVIGNTIDPSSIQRSLPGKQQDLAIAANNSWVLSFDNLSGLQPWASDTLCRLERLTEP